MIALLSRTTPWTFSELALGEMLLLAGGCVSVSFPRSLEANANAKNLSNIGEVGPGWRNGGVEYA